MLPGLKPVARASLSDHIVGQITELITSGAWKAGDRIPSEKQLCEQFSVGRTSVREALKSLSAMGIVEAHAGDGTFVSSNTGRNVERALQMSLLLDAKVLDDLIETRLLLESETAAIAARRASEADLDEMADAVAGMKASLQLPERFLEQDLRFHIAVAKATQNSILQSLLQTTRAYLHAWIKEILSTAEAAARSELSVKEHSKILRALKSGNPDVARRAMSAHILSSSKDLTRARRGSNLRTS